MSTQEMYLTCFGIGSLWSLLALVLGGLHAGHAGHSHGHLGHGHSTHGHHAGAHSSSLAGWFGILLSPSCIAIFLAWFGGVGYLLTRHSTFGWGIDLFIAALLGIVGAALLAQFLLWLQSHEKPLEDADLIGTLGRVSSTIRAGGVGEMIFVSEGSRRAVPARSEDGNEIKREEEVVITRYEKGIAQVRTWEALTQPAAEKQQPKSLPEETENDK